MKKLIVLLLLLPLLSFTTVQDNSKFIGKWVGEDQKEIGIINFDTDGYAHFIIQGKIFGGV